MHSGQVSSFADSGRILLLLGLCGQVFGFSGSGLCALGRVRGRSGNGCSLTMMAKVKSDKLQVLLKGSVEGIGKANQVVQVEYERSQQSRHMFVITEHAYRHTNAHKQYFNTGSSVSSLTL